MMKLGINSILRVQVLHHNQLGSIPNRNRPPQIHSVGLKDRKQDNLSATLISLLLENS